MKLSAVFIVCVVAVALCKAESSKKDEVVKKPWKECAPLYGLDPGNYAYVINAKNRGVTGCLYRKIGLFKEDGTFNYDYNLPYPQLPERTKLDSILKGCSKEANSDYDRLAACYNRETEGIVRKY